MERTRPRGFENSPCYSSFCSFALWSSARGEQLLPWGTGDGGGLRRVGLQQGYTEEWGGTRSR